MSFVRRGTEANAIFGPRTFAVKTILEKKPLLTKREHHFTETSCRSRSEGGTMPPLSFPSGLVRKRQIDAM
jgi:hypothetical protein